MGVCQVPAILLFLLFSNNGGHAILERDSVCMDHVVKNLTNELVNSHKIVIDSMLNTFTGITLDKTSVHEVYKAFAKKFSRNTTASGYSHFVESLNMISSYYYEANFNPEHLQNISTLTERFKEAFGTKNSAEISNIFATILNIKDDDERSRRRRSSEECSCPREGINSQELLYSCQFFDCLDNGRQLSHIFEGFEGFECLAFVLDTTGSMKDEIDTTIEVITDLIASEQIGCYVLVPFNDDGTLESSVGPVTLTFVDDADPYSITSLRNLISNLENSFRKNSGGDCPEYCYSGILEALELVDEGFPVMTYGSQVVVVTDAPSKGPNSAREVIAFAKNAEVCVHFFLGRNTFNCFETSPNEYDRVASATGGIVVDSKFDFASFVQKYRTTPCSFFDNSLVKKRSPTAQFCHNFTISSMACFLSLTTKTTDDIVRITKPNGEQVAVNASGDHEEKLALFAENEPQPGQWSICGDNPIEVSFEDHKCIDITPYFIKNETGRPALTAEVSTGCVNAHIMVVSSQSAEISSPELEIVDLQNRIAAHAPLQTCGDAMSANITMPTTGHYYYRITGRDEQRMPFSHLIQRKLAVSSGASHYSLSSVGPQRLQVQYGQIVRLEFELNSTNDFGSVHVNFSIDEDIQRTIVPSDTNLTHEEAVRVVVTIHPSASQQNVTLRVSNDCINITARRTVITTRSASTTPVPQACSPTCLNGGRCVAVRRRQRVFHLCRCPSGYRGRACERQV